MPTRDCGRILYKSFNMNKLTLSKPLAKINKWNTLPWSKIHGRVFKLQRTIYNASLKGNIVKVRRFQHLLICSVDTPCDPQGYSGQHWQMYGGC